MLIKLSESLQIQTTLDISLNKKLGAEPSHEVARVGFYLL